MSLEVFPPLQFLEKVLAGRFIFKQVELIKVSGQDEVGEKAEWDLFVSYINFFLVAVQNLTGHVSGEI